MRRNRRVIAAALASAGVGVAAVAWTAPAAHATTSGGTAAVIIFFKSEFAGTASRDRSAERLAQIQAAQVPHLGQLRSLGATDVHRYRLVNAIAARVPSAALGAVAASAGVAAVIPDSVITGPTLPPAPTVTPTTGTPSTAYTGGAATTSMRTPKGACSSAPQLEPEGLTLTRTAAAAKSARTARSLGYTGAGVRVGFLADGIDTANPNLMRDGKPVITDYQDFSGDGTTAATAGGAAFLDASTIAGQGSAVYDVAGFSAQRPATPCRVTIEGAAPGASLVALKVYNRAGTTTTSALLQAIDYAVTTDHVNVLDESFGAAPFPDLSSLNAVKKFNDMAVAAGTAVVVAAGDGGPLNTIGTPAADRHVISVGASTDFRSYQQTDYAGADQFARAGWEDDNISSLSSGGYGAGGRTLDLVAPGDQSFASCTPDAARYSSCVDFLGKPSAVEAAAGTSAAAPLVAGAAALVIQAYARQHQGAAPTPAVVKQILLSTATDLGAPATEQGSGMLNTLKAVELASWQPHGHAATAAPTLRLSNSQLNVVGRPGAVAHWTVTVTNAAATRQTVSVAGRGFSAATTVKRAVVSLASTSPHFTDWTGAAANYAAVRFAVPRGQALLNTSIAWAAGPAEAPVRVILVDPAGKLAADSLPQSSGGYGSGQVLHPAAGTWTAVISSETFTGRVLFGATVSAATSFGSVFWDSTGSPDNTGSRDNTGSPSRLVLAPGAAATVDVSARIPAGAGDSSGSVVLDAGPAAAGPVSVPVTLRGQVQVAPGTVGKFGGVLTGGNGRVPGQGQVAAYSFIVPSNLPVLLRSIDADVTLAAVPASQVSAYLVAPGGETMGYGSSYLTTGFTASGVAVERPQRQLSVYTSNPVPGTWTLVIDFTSPVPGSERPDAFTGRVRLNTSSYGRGALPDSPSVTLPRGVPVTYQIAVRNTGVAPEDVFLDPRLVNLRSYRLQPQDPVAGVPLPLPASRNPPEWLVPTMTHSVAVTATAAVPVMFDAGPVPGDPDEPSSAGRTATAAFPANRAVTPVSQGLWLAVPSPVGPFGAGGAPRTTVSATMSAVTQQFDTTANPASGDFWRFAVSSLAPHASYNLFVVNPGQTRTISLTVTPSGTAGTVVRGILYIDDFADSPQFLSGSQLAALPYAYAVG